MDEWRSAERVHERRLWSTLTVVGAVLAVTLASSLVVTAVGEAEGVRFYVQQAILLILSGTGTALAARRWHASQPSR